jgi:hypothetical protein
MLQSKNNLYYCDSDLYTVQQDILRSACHKTHAPMTKASQIESELWLLRLGSPGEHQLDTLPSCADGIPSRFACNPFRSIDFKEQASIHKQAHGATSRLWRRILHGQTVWSFHMTAAVHTSLSLMASLTTKSKDQPVAIIRSFMTKFGKKS